MCLGNIPTSNLNKGNASRKNLREYFIYQSNERLGNYKEDQRKLTSEI